MAQHSIFGAGTPPGMYGLYNDAGGAITMGSCFYVGTGETGWTCTGAKLWVPSGVTLPATVTIEARYGTTLSTNNLDTPALRQATVPTIAGPAWIEVSRVPFAIESGVNTLISYTFPTANTNYLFATSPNNDFIGATDGTKIYLSETVDDPNIRSYYRIDNGTVTLGLNSPFYGVDIIVDDNDTPPIAAYGFNELAGVTAADSSGNGHDLTLNSSSNLDVSREGNGLHQVGGGSVNKITNTASWLQTSQRTVMFWGRRGTEGADTLSQTVYQTDTSANTVFGISLSDGTNAQFTVRQAGIPIVITAPEQALGSWHHYALTYDEQVVCAYIDGVLVGQQVATGAIDTSDGNLYFYGEDYQQQVVDDLRFFDTALSLANIVTYRDTVIAAPDVAPPTVPTNVTATVTYGQVVLNWDAATDNVAVQNYVVYRSSSSGFTPTPADQVGGPSGTSYSEVIAPGTYYYRVAARDEAGNESTASPEQSATTTASPSTEYLYPSGLGWTEGTEYTDSVSSGMSFGVLFGVDRPVPLIGVHFYSPAIVSGVSIAISEEDGTILATKAGLNLVVGWNTLLLDTPYVGIYGIAYVASLFVPGTSVSYAAQTNYFTGTRTQVGPIYSQNGQAGRYGVNTQLPTILNANWYGVDVIASESDAPVNGAFGADIVAENALAGSPSSGWTIGGAGDTTNLGFTREFSYNAGETVTFSCHGTGTVIDIYRIGSYGGIGWRQVATIGNTPTAQPDPDIVPNSNGGVACTNWSTTASWTIPSDALSGLFVGVYRNTGHDNASYIPFCVRNDARAVDIVVKLSETTWALAYNYYGTPSSPLTGKSVYGSGGPLGNISTRAHIGSYHRPIVTREGISQTYWLGCEAPLIRYLESNGFNVKYVASKDVDANLAVLNPSQVAISSGHDEYWSDGMRDAFEAYRDSGGHVLFMSGNEVFWRVRFSADHTMMWVYKDTMDGPGVHVGGTPLDPVSWTGTWKDTRWPGHKAEKTITGTDFRMNGVNDIAAIFDHTAEYAAHPVWRDTAVATGTSVTVQGIIGFEADEIAPTQPTASTAVLAQHTITINGARADDNGQSYNGNGDLDWGVVSQRYASGAVVVGFGTCQWAWGLNGVHDRGGNYTHPALQQATLNLLTDLGAAPATATGDLVTPTAVSSLDVYGAVPGASERSGKVNVWGGSAWSGHPLKVWDGATWVERSAAGHDGTDFIAGK